MIVKYNNYYIKSNTNAFCVYAALLSTVMQYIYRNAAMYLLPVVPNNT